MKPEREKQLDEVLMRNTEDIATMSKAIRKKTGALVYKDTQTISFGWNGMPTNSVDDGCELKDENSNYILTDAGELITNPLVLHAEANAILKLAANGGFGTKGATLYCTLSPCPECAKLILQAKIIRVVFREWYRLPDGVDILERYGVKCEQLLFQPLC